MHFEALRASLPDVGNYNAIYDIVSDYASGNTKEANLAAFNAAYGYMAGNITPMAMQIASLGTFFINYSLTSFAEETLGAQNTAYEHAYREFYRKRLGYSSWLEADGTVTVFLPVRDMLKIGPVDAITVRVADKSGARFMNVALPPPSGLPERARDRSENRRPPCA